MYTANSVYFQALEAALALEVRTLSAPPGMYFKHNARKDTYAYAAANGQKGKYLGPLTSELETALNESRPDYELLAIKGRYVAELMEAGYPCPAAQSATVIKALADAGAFRLRGVLVGTNAFQCYAPMLGEKVGQEATATNDVDIAQFKSISGAIGDALTRAIQDILKDCGEFRQLSDFDWKPIPKWRDVKTGFSLDLLTPFIPPEPEGYAYLPAIRTKAIKLKFLDYLIYREIPALVLALGGIRVNVPRPERYCVHKILVAHERGDKNPKYGKDLGQTAWLADWFVRNDPETLREAIIEAIERGPGWRKRIRRMCETESALDTLSKTYVQEIFGKKIVAALPGGNTLNQIIRRKLVIEEPEKLFFISDTHFCHENSIKLCRRPFHNVYEMNEAIIANWNTAISDEDEVVVIGDIFWTEDKISEYRAIMHRLQGRKHLIFGNHDYFSAQQYLAMGFISAQPYLEVVVGKIRIDCFHYPMLEWNGYYKGALHFHGHAHGNSSHFSRRVLDVGVDPNGFKPIRWIDIAGKYEEIIKEELARIRADERRTYHRPYVFRKGEF